MLKMALAFVAAALLGACASKTVVVKKSSCKDIYDGILMECEIVKK